MEVLEGGEKDPKWEGLHRVPVRIRVRFVGAPETLRLQAGERDLLEGQDFGTSPIECEAELEIGREGNELVLEAKWPEGSGEAAVTVELEPEGLDGHSETRWSEGGQISDVLTFVW